MNSLLRRAVVARQIPRRSVITATRAYVAPQEPDPQLNGYPELPWVSRQSLPPLGWQDNLLRRNFGDTLHEQEEVLSMWGPDVPPIDPYIALRHFLIATACFVAAGYTIKEFLTPDVPATRREYPYNGLVRELGGLEENKARPEVVDTED